ncbi:hypothetical protein BRD13_05645 [Halobacteriales archaeon SW_5_70_135]|nr:MAG: hypothetical protein BRD13_05645 [Halobacteriales archaeon SW_5_70_135]
MLKKDLLRVDRRGGYRPQFAGEDAGALDLARRVVGVFQGAVGKPRADLDVAVEAVERDAADYKLVRGLADLLERDAVFETRAPVPPERAREVAFECAGEVGVVTRGQRREALARAAERLNALPGRGTADTDTDADTDTNGDEDGNADLTAAAVGESLYADLPERQVLVAFDPRWDPEALLRQYDLSLAQTALFDAVEVRARSADPKRLVSAVKRLGLMYELVDEPTDDPDLGDRVAVVTGPDALFRRTRRYGTAFARLLRTLAATGRWELTATVDDRGTERTLSLSNADPVAVPGTDPVVDVGYDSGVEREFATRFEALDLDWRLVREPDLLPVAGGAMVPDFAFEYEHADFRVYFEIVGFWTPSYVESKLAKLKAVDAELLVAVDRSLGVGEAVEAADHRVVRYDDRVRLKDVRDALRVHEERLAAESAADLPDELRPTEDAVAVETLAERHGVPESAVEDREFPEHRLVGRTLARPALLERLDEAIEPGQDLADAASVAADHGIDDAASLLSALGYRVEWSGLSGGTVRRRE